MGWVAPVASAGNSNNLSAGRQASLLGKYNQAIQERNAQVAEQEAELIERQKEFDIARFDKQFQQLQGQTKTALLNLVRKKWFWFKNIKIKC
jgi:hypothetical protein